MSNIEQGISNHEVEPSLPFPSVFDTRYSTCPLCREADLRKICLYAKCHGFRSCAKEFAGQAGILRFTSLRLVRV
jgi:hypothetical protein